MEPREALEKRLEAKRKIMELFDEKRRKLKVSPLRLSAEDQFKRDFLGRLNTLAREMEIKAMNAAENGEKIDKIIEEAKKEIEKLKKEFAEEIEDQIWGAKFAKLVEEIRNL